jgi:hypothetical protein
MPSDHARKVSLMSAEAHSRIKEENLPEIPQGRITEFGFERNIEVALRYM